MLGMYDEEEDVREGGYEEEDVGDVTGGSSGPFLILPRSPGFRSQRGLDLIRLFLWPCHSCNQ